ncbi:MULTISPECIES: oligosaccharide flippase family protein [unclassified Acidovorax]|uniref:oligosaccharide flippase family protein n=1 Tax=unclassified Acidovorax TaxID=2684926 RepID=UPI0028832C1B|nr:MULTISPECIES: oligosaccharide flippase family protein [unclassified Acidovorax]
MRLSHVAWNLAGLAVPLAVAALTVPQLLANVGHEKFGLLALAWGLIGYASGLDLGIGRALTQRVAGLRGAGKDGEVPDVLATAGRITLIAGLFFGLLVVLAVPAGAPGWVHAVSTPRSEIATAVLLLALALPAQAMSATYRGLNEAYLNFRGISLLRAALGVVNFAGPFFVSLATPHLGWLVLPLVASRLLSLAIYRALAWRCIRQGGEARTGHYQPATARALFAFGGWVTVSSVVSPVLVQADRFTIGAVLSAAAVSAYVLPYEVVVQSLVLAGAVSSVMFPGLSRLLLQDPHGWRPYFLKWLRRVAVLMGLVCGLLAVMLPWLLQAWIGDELQPVSVMVGQILCLGVFANALGTLFYALLHARGRADITARMHLAELPVFLMLLGLLISQYGLPGAAWAWTLRMVADASLLAFFSLRHSPQRAVATP